MRKHAIVLTIPVESRIFVLRGQKVILDAHLAELYGVKVKRLNEQVKRNARRFPADFVFRLTTAEQKSLRSQFATSKQGRGGRRFRPYVFTEHGAIMAANILNSERAVEMALFVVRAFVRMREALATNQEVLAKLKELEGRIEAHDSEIQQLIEAIKELMAPQPLKHRRIGFELPTKASRTTLRFRARS